MDQFIQKAKRGIRDARRTALKWTQQRVLDVSNTDSASLTGFHDQSLVDDAEESDLPQTGCTSKDTYKILFQIDKQPHKYPQPCFHTIPDPACLTIKSVEELGEVHSATTYVKRDLGFQGRFGPYTVLAYGDTLYTDSDYSDTFRGIVSNSLALATHDPTIVVDCTLNESNHPRQFIPVHQDWDEDPSTHAIGITNIIELPSSPQSKTKNGVVFTLLNHRPDQTNNLVGAGLATITLDQTIYPPSMTADRIAPCFWNGDIEPWYGDVCALHHNSHIYAYGHAKDSPFVYLARVPIDNIRIEAFEYYHGPIKKWSATRLVSPNLDESQSIFWQINQGQIIWSNHFSCFLFVYCDNFWSSQVLIRWSHHPEGPWSADPITAYKATPITEGGNIYAAVPHDYYDRSGRSLVVTFTNYPNCLQAVRIIFG